MTIRRAYVDSRYGQLHYRIATPAGRARRPPLLCLHQTPKSGWEYEPIMPGLAQDRVVLAPDTPGYGASDAPPAPVQITDYAGVMAQFMDDMAARGVVADEPYDIMGYHTGSIVASAMGNAWPAKVRRLVLVSLAAYEAPVRAEKLRNIGDFPTPKPDASNITDLFRLQATMVDARASLAWRHAGLAETLRPGARAPWGYIAVYNHDFLGSLAALTQEAMILAPQDDLWDVTRRTAPIVPHGTLVELPGAAHGFLAIDTDKVCGLIRAFLDR